MQRRELSVVISKPIRKNKRNLTSIVDIERSRRVSTHDRIINVLKEYKKGLPLTEIQYEGKISSMGNLHHTIKFMVRAGEVNKEKCPHCSSTELYKLNI
jgi:hypothetical protein